MMPTRSIVVATIMMLLMAGSATAAEVGKPAPGFSLAGKIGNVDLAKRRGKVVILDFWASWCVPCKAELPALDALAKRYKAQGLPIEVIAVNIDEQRQSADAFLKDAKVGHVTVAYDPGGKVAEKYDLPTMPTSFVIGPDGVIREIHAGYREGDEKKLAARAESLAPAPDKKPRRNKQRPNRSPTK